MVDGLFSITPNSQSVVKVSFISSLMIDWSSFFKNLDTMISSALFMDDLITLISLIIDACRVSTEIM